MYIHHRKGWLGRETLIMRAMSRIGGSLTGFLRDIQCIIYFGRPISKNYLEYS